MLRDCTIYHSSSSCSKSELGGLDIIEITSHFDFIQSSSMVIPSCFSLAFPWWLVELFKYRPCVCVWDSVNIHESWIPVPETLIVNTFSILPSCGLTFHFFPHRLFWRAECYHFDEAQYIHFFFYVSFLFTLRNLFLFKVKIVFFLQAL